MCPKHTLVSSICDISGSAVARNGIRGPASEVIRLRWSRRDQAVKGSCQRHRSESRRSSPRFLKVHAALLAAGFPAPLPELVAATSDESLQRWPIRDIPPLAHWSKGRITLAGDAAHATSPYAAYGAGMSICDGYFLGQRLAGVDLRDTAAVQRALVAYETPRILHTREQVQSAYLLGKLFHHAPRNLGARARGRT
ncbi:hypothetical protein GCM10022240_07060 [Microbacterium kribbense]|uniref:FAD-binding domain-containing protein n=1 Tax=Microbacterium kribbense TaxID=433645 RepID=A0ABP7G704_9MICO